MKDWKCTYVNPTDKSKTPCGAIVPSKTQPKSACPSCGRKNKWEEVVVAVVAVVSVGPTAWPIPLSARLQTALAGQYVTTDTNAAGDAPDGVANTTYGAGKHWGAGPNKWEAGQYDLPNIGPEQVAGLEVKACRLGLETVGGWVFTFGFNVGHTCMKGNNKGLSYDVTKCIRVDSGSSLAQGRHSHPIPPWGGLETSSHEKEVKNVIIAAVNSFDEDALAEVGEYLKVIGATSKSYGFTLKENAKLKNPLPQSFYW